MAEEAWLSGKLENYSDLLMPAAHALVEAIRDLVKFAELSNDELLDKPNGSPTIAFHLLHLAGSCDRLLSYAKGEELTEQQLHFLKNETSSILEANAENLVKEAVAAIENVLEFCRSVSPEILFEARFVGRKRLQTNAFGLLFHIAEHTARHVGQIITTAKIVRKN